MDALETDDTRQNENPAASWKGAVIDKAPSDDNIKVATLLVAMLSQEKERGRGEGREGRSSTSRQIFYFIFHFPRLSLAFPFSFIINLNMNPSRLSSALLAAIAALLISCQSITVDAFHLPSRAGAKSSSLGMAPRFDKATQKWFPTNPEVSRICILVQILSNMRRTKCCISKPAI